MECWMNNELKTEIDLLITKIKDSNEYKEYLNLLEQLKDSNLINNLVEEIRNINKKLVKTPSIKLQEKLALKQKELNEIPLYQDYIEKLEILNNMLLLVKDKFDKYIETLLI